jgi:short subunit dehydrogenase-like uncharacterized protein
MNSAPWLLYGANGYSGRLILEEALKRGHSPVLAGRSREKIEPLAEKYRLRYHHADLQDTVSVRRMLEGMPIVLNAAGPFVATASPLIKACFETGTHYLDITGEISVFERIFALDRKARAHGLALLPGVGFDVVPTDCLASHTALKVNNPKHLEIAFTGLGGLSAGTLKTYLRGIHAGILVRRDGRLTRLDQSLRRTVRFADRTRTVMPLSWGDLSTAFHSTSIPDITVYSAAPRLLSMTWPSLLNIGGKLLRVALLRTAIQKWIDSHVHGPDTARRLHTKSQIWCRVSNEAGESAQSWLSAPEAYQLTAHSAVRAIEHLQRTPVCGSLTPSKAFGADFILEIPGTVRIDSFDSDANVYRFRFGKAA